MSTIVIQAIAVIGLVLVGAGIAELVRSGICRMADRRKGFIPESITPTGTAMVFDGEIWEEA